jgi:hypothetical protein
MAILKAYIEQQRTPNSTGLYIPNLKGGGFTARRITLGRIDHPLT